jgi:hypothetical protein
MYVCTAQQESTAPAAGTTLVTDSTSYIADLSLNIIENARVVLSWKQPEDTSLLFAVIERSTGGRNFEVVAALKQNELKPDNEWIDDAPAKGRSMYRIRFSGKDGQPLYSNVASATLAGDISFRFYPNPVDNILIVRSESLLDIQITDATGKQRMAVTNLQGLQTINVSSLEKGVYYMRINNRSTGLVTQDKLLKN